MGDQLPEEFIVSIKSEEWAVRSDFSSAWIGLMGPIGHIGPMSEAITHHSSIITLHSNYVHDLIGGDGEQVGVFAVDDLGLHLVRRRGGSAA